jgi:hypothetical protein
LHDDIIRFSRTGVTENNAKNRELMVRDMEVEMRDLGFVPSLDNEPQYTVEFNRESQIFHFEVSVYGVKVGALNSWQISGVSNGKMIT